MKKKQRAHTALGAFCTATMLFAGTTALTAQGAVFGIAPDPAPNAAESNRWIFETTPYGWASGLNGVVGAGDHTVNVNVSFRDVLKKLDGALMFAGGVSHGAVAIGYEVIYVNLSSEPATPGPLFSSASLGAKQFVFELTPRYRFSRNGPVKIDLFTGGRFWKLSNTVTLEPGLLRSREFKDKERWLDPIVGVSGVADLGRWLIQSRADLGGFTIGSSGTWQWLGVVGYRFGDTVAAKAGYRHLRVDFADDDKGFLFGVAMSGWIVGATFAF